MKKYFLLLLLCTSYYTTQAQTKEEQAIKGLLDAQVIEWNAGSIDGYMHGYWDNDSLLFIGSKGPRYGYKTTLEKYKEGYPDAAHMGKLTFTVKSIQKLSPEYYFIVGAWALKREAGDVSGSSTLLVHKIKGHWVIVADHSS